MSQKNLLVEYIAENLRELHPFFQWKSVENQSKNIVEVYITFREKVNEETQVQDIIGQNNTRGYIQFEDVICFYDPKISHIRPENYLKSFPFDYNQGIEKGFVEAVLKQLHIEATNGHGRLKEFVEDDTISEFSMEWSDENFEMTLQTLRDTKRYSDEKLHIELTSQESIIEQFMEGKHDGVERV